MQLLKAGKEEAAVVATLEAACTPPAPAPPAKTASLLLRLRKTPALQQTQGKGFCITPCGKLRPADITAARDGLLRTPLRKPVLPQLE